MFLLSTKYKNYFLLFIITIKVIIQALTYKKLSKKKNKILLNNIHDIVPINLHKIFINKTTKLFNRTPMKISTT